MKQNLPARSRCAVDTRALKAGSPVLAPNSACTTCPLLNTIIPPPAVSTRSRRPVLPPIEIACTSTSISITPREPWKVFTAPSAPTASSSLRRTLLPPFAAAGRDTAGAGDAGVAGAVGATKATGGGSGGAAGGGATPLGIGAGGGGLNAAIGGSAGLGTDTAAAGVTGGG